VSILSIVAWELLKMVALRAVSVRLYRRVSDDMVVHVDVRRWDAEGLNDLLAKGYLEEYPDRRT
jgi:hypothetical protein